MTKSEGTDAGDWVSGPAPPDGNNTGPAAPWGTDSVGFYDGNRQLGEEMQWWIGLSSDDEQRHLRREFYEDDSTTLLIADQSANNVTDGRRAVEFFMPWAKIRDDESFEFHTPDHTLQDLAVGYSFRLDPLLVDGAGDGSMYNGQAFPGGATGPLDVAEADQSIVVLAEAPAGGGGGPTGDFDGNGTFDCADVNALAAAVGSADAAFDMNGDGSVTLDDITGAGTGWLTAAGAANTAATSGNPFVHGDENLDGAVDSSDLGLLLNNFGATESAAYCGGDLDADGAVTSSDLGLLLNNFGGAASSASAAAVPEPSGFALLVSLASGLLLVRRRR